MLAGVAPLGMERVALGDALGRALAEDAVATVALPPRDNASMDGFAVRADDVRSASAEAPARWMVIEGLAAASIAPLPLGKGEPSRTITGASVPAGADSVVRVEDTQSEG